MATIPTYVGSFTLRSGPGTQEITGIGFRPKAILLWSVARSAATGFETGDQWQFFGLSDGTHHAAVSHRSRSGSLATSFGHRDDSAFIVVDGAGVLDTQCDGVSFTDDGAVLNFAASGSGGILIDFILFGGDGLQVRAGDAVTPGSTGHQSVTGVGFVPDVVIFLACSAGGNFNTNTGFGPNGLGWMTASAQGASSNDTAVGPGRLRRYQRTDRCVVSHGYAGAGYEAEKVSLDSDGFTINWLTAHVGQLPYLALKGVTVTAGAIDAPASSGSSTITVTLFPVAALFLANGNIASTSDDDTVSEMAFGAVDRSNRQRVNWSADKDAAGTTARYESDTAAIVTANATATLQSRGVAALSGHDVTITWTISSADQAQVLYLIFADTAPIAYEDPCAMTNLRVIAKITTETEVLRYSGHPLRQDSGGGGFHEPRVLEIGPIIKSASDPFTGSWEGQSATATLADTDHSNRARSEARFGLRHCAMEIYLGGKAHLAAGGAPRVLAAGEIVADSQPENLVFGVELNDPIGANYSLTNEEVLIPQRTIDVNWFPGCPAANLNLSEPIVGGERKPRDTSNGEGVTYAPTVGRITIGATPGTPTGTTLAALVAALQAAKTGGTLISGGPGGSDTRKWGDIFGWADIQSLDDYGGAVPADFDRLSKGKDYDAGLAPFIGLGESDVSAYLTGAAATGGSVFVAAMIAGHAIKAIRNGANGDKSVWIDDTQLDAAEENVSWFVDLSRDITGADGVVQRYSLIRFTPGSTYGDLVENGGRVHLDCDGMEDVGDSSGTLIENAIDMDRHLARNFWLQKYQTGAWKTGPFFTWADGVTVLDRINDTSYEAAKDVAALQLSDGRKCSFTIGPERISLREITKKACVSWGLRRAMNDYQQYIVQTLDFRRTEFLTNAAGVVHRTLKHKTDIFGFRLDPRPDWQANRVYYQYAKNSYTGTYERGAGGGGKSLYVEYAYGVLRDGLHEQSLVLDFVADDLTALTIAGNFRDLFANLPRLGVWKRPGPCSLEDDVLDGVPITHYNGNGSVGAVNRAFWIWTRTYRRGHSEFVALDVDPLLSAIENPQPTVGMFDPVALYAGVLDQDGTTVGVMD